MKSKPIEQAPDPVDQAANLTQWATDHAIESARQEANKIDTGNPSGDCWFCGAKTGPDRRWCDAECRNLYEAER